MNIGFKTNVMPITAKILNKLEPMILPIIILYSFLLTAMKDVASSGAEVPNATKVPATIKGDTFRIFDKSTAPLTSKSPEKASTKKPEIKLNHIIT